MNPVIEKLLLASGLIFAALTAITPIFVIPHFVNVFSTFGTDLPLITQIVLKFYGVTAVLPLLVLIAWFFWPNRSHRAIAACITGFGGGFLFASIIMLSMYWPIFKMSPSI
jgi:type II secretory pathway component PulF